MGKVKVDTVTNVAGTGAPNIPDGITLAGVALASANTMEYTESATEPSSPKNGAIWWKTGDNKFYQYVNEGWGEITYSVTGALGGRGLFGGGSNINGANNTIDYVTISTTGNATDFGDLGAIFPRELVVALGTLSAKVNVSH